MRKGTVNNSFVIINKLMCNNTKLRLLYDYLRKKFKTVN